ncbi:MAG: hypothetical protein ABSF23_08245 [Terracidiphilus sp.]|jgi:hypothetical protein
MNAPKRSLDVREIAMVAAILLLLAIATKIASQAPPLHLDHLLHGRYRLRSSVANPQ